MIDPCQPCVEDGKCWRPGERDCAVIVPPEPLVPIIPPWDPHDVWNLKPCDNPACDHQTSRSSAYCCGSCVVADRTHSEIHAHSFTCLERHEKRGPVPGR